ncbi:serine protease, S1-C subfamily, contains C-terminal PDZ domain [Paenibacillus sp. UNCCL117]|uniref:S1C family serine protease n=1 Tax=unclassified Paenibacillus TaxID=185978 RepID=UPI000888CC69|nr:MULTISPECIES: trypsin-like peptidase domain-containing protein [unclassified Paenibacillus]SDE68880.1 serine protease, S1-C subfamily, contains C-terminal PDZ domain [Paenibacillus sp. cl123]SFW66492.1 serine protease, S1-C subfamily, contains C-terminal PDZ domain [Paenibacillus sp. UNCCL117]
MDNKMTRQTPNAGKAPKLRGMVAAFLAGTMMTGGLMLASDKMNLFTPVREMAAATEAAAASAGTATPAAAQAGVETAAVSLGANGGISDIVEQSKPAVVKIETKIKAGNSANSRFSDPRYRQFFGSQGETDELQDGGMGTGFIFEKSGYILTNEHVIEGAEEIWVTVEGYDKPLKATLLGNSYDLDLAVLKIEGDKDFPYLPLGDPDQVKVGDWLVAIGNPYGYDQTVTVGVLSAKERPISIQGDQGTREYKHLLQTDTSINPGNSGGPLLNMNGEVIGINTAVNAEAQGMGFAIPTSTIASVLENLKNNVAIPKEPVPYLGVALEDVSDEWASDLKLSDKTGAVITQIVPKSPAFAAGIRTYDVITAVNGHKVANAEELSAKIKELAVGDQITLTTVRDGKTSDVAVTIGNKNAE